MDAEDSNGRTPLHAAAFEGHEAAAKALIKAGANVNAKDNDGWTPLDWAESKKHEAVAAMLRIVR